MHYFLFAEKDSTIYGDSVHSNTGLDQILEIEKQLVHSENDTPYNSRILIKFDLSDFSASLVSGQTSGSDMRYYLNLYTSEAIEIPLEYTIYAYPVSQSWEMGIGKKSDIPITKTGVSWQIRDGITVSGDTGSLWAATGSDYISGSGYESSQSFSFQTTDIHMDITTMVQAWLSGSLENHGILLKRSDVDEQSILNQGTLQFFSNETHTIYRPRLEAVWKDFSYSPRMLTTTTYVYNALSSSYSMSHAPIISYTTQSFYRGSSIFPTASYFTQSGDSSTWYSESYYFTTASIWSYTSSIALYHSSSYVTSSTYILYPFTSGSDTIYSSSLVSTTTTAYQYYTGSLGDEFRAGVANWQAQTAPTQSWLNIAYGSGTFIAITSDGIVMSSSDGQNWSSIYDTQTNSVISITYGSGSFVGVGSGSTVIYSNDQGKNWYSSSIESSRWQGVTYGSNSFVAVSQEGITGFSTNALTWTTHSAAHNTNWWAVTYGSGTFVSVAFTTSTGSIMTSPDGISWTPRVNPVSRLFQTITYGNGTFVATPLSSSGGGAIPIYSVDSGVTWLTGSFDDNNNISITSVAFGDRSNDVPFTKSSSIFVGVARSSGEKKSAYSFNGKTWITKDTIGDINNWRGIVYSPSGSFVAVSTDADNRVQTLDWINSPCFTDFGMTSSAVWTYNSAGYYYSQSFIPVTASYTYVSSSLLGTYATESSSTTTQTMYPLSSEDFVIYLSNFYEKYRQNSKARFRVKCREKYPRRTYVTESWTYTRDESFMPTQSYYAIREGWSDFEWIPFSSYTQLSVDASGSYFDLWLTGLEPENFYRFMFKVVQNSGSVNQIERIFDDEFSFLITR